jgi:hypothetical protein
MVAYIRIAKYESGWLGGQFLERFAIETEAIRPCPTMNVSNEKTTVDDNYDKEPVDIDEVELDWRLDPHASFSDWKLASVTKPSNS